MEEFKNYINGKWIDSTSKQFVDVLSPSDNKVFAKIQNLVVKMLTMLKFCQSRL